MRQGRQGRSSSFISFSDQELQLTTSRKTTSRDLASQDEDEVLCSFMQTLCPCKIENSSPIPKPSGRTVEGSAQETNTPSYNRGPQPTHVYTEKTAVERGMPSSPMPRRRSGNRPPCGEPS